jgi:hypothetical protein
MVVTWMAAARKFQMKAQRADLNPWQAFQIDFVHL